MNNQCPMRNCAQQGFCNGKTTPCECEQLLRERSPMWRVAITYFCTLMLACGTATAVAFAGLGYLYCKYSTVADLLNGSLLTRLAGAV